MASKRTAINPVRKPEDPPNLTKQEMGSERASRTAVFLAQSLGPLSLVSGESSQGPGMSSQRLGQFAQRLGILSRAPGRPAQRLGVLSRALRGSARGREGFPGRWESIRKPQAGAIDEKMELA